MRALDNSDIGGVAGAGLRLEYPVVLPHLDRTCEVSTGCGYGGFRRRLCNAGMRRLGCHRRLDGWRAGANLPVGMNRLGRLLDKRAIHGECRMTEHRRHDKHNKRSSTATTIFTNRFQGETHETLPELVSSTSLA